MEGRLPTGPRAHGQQQQQLRGQPSPPAAPKLAHSAANGSLSPVGVPTGPKAMKLQAAGSGRGQSPVQASSPTAINGNVVVVVPSGPRSMLNNHASPRTNGLFANVAAITGSSASRKAPSLSISLGSSKEPPESVRRDARTAASAFQRERDAPAASTSGGSASSSSYREGKASLSHYKPSPREAEIMARAAVQGSQQSKPREPTSAPPPPPGASSASAGGTSSSIDISTGTKLQAPKMAIQLKAATGPTIAKLPATKSIFDAANSSSSSKNSVVEGSSSYSNPLKQLGKTSSGLDKGKQPERLAEDAVRPPSPTRQRQISSSRPKMFLPDHLDKDEIMAEASYPRPDGEDTPPPRAKPQIQEGQSHDTQSLIAQAAAEARSRVASLLKAMPEARSRDVEAERAMAFLAHKPLKAPSVSPLSASDDTPTASTSRQRQISKEEGEVTPASASFPGPIQEPNTLLRMGSTATFLYHCLAAS